MLLTEAEALKKYRPFVIENDPYGYGQDVFLNNHAAVVIPEFSTGSGVLYLFDSKTPGYPQVNFVGKYVFPGGNRRKGIQEEPTPYDVLKEELMGEWKDKKSAANGKKFAELVLSYARPYADYMIAVPREIHGNPKLPSQYVFVATFYLSSIPSKELTGLGINTDGGLEEVSQRLMEFILPFYGEAEPVVVDRNSLVNGTAPKQFAWGYDRVMNDYLMSASQNSGNLGLGLGISFIQSIEADRLNIEPGLPYTGRLTNMRDRLNPAVRGETTTDPHVFEPR